MSVGVLMQMEQRSYKPDLLALSDAQNQVEMFFLLKFSHDNAQVRLTLKFI